MLRHGILAINADFTRSDIDVFIVLVCAIMVFFFFYNVLCVPFS